ncbi:MAG: galactokinase family protein [Clostridia bacterium]
MLNQQSINGLATNNSFKNCAAALYGAENFNLQVERYTNLYNHHKNLYCADAMFFSSPGRIEVCGNHTDHNNGKVLCASITVDTVACVTPSSKNEIIIDSIGFPVVKISLDNLTLNKKEYGTSEALVKGVVAYFIKNNYKIGGFTASTTSSVFKGAGVSSSACFEVLVCEILNTLYNNNKMDAITKAKASHYAESVYFGKPCGLMDQSAIAIGGVSYIDFKNTKQPKVEGINWAFKGVDIVLINTGGDHCDLTDDYASIRLEMEQVAQELGKNKLRKVSEKVFYDNLVTLQTKVSGRAILRAMHFFEENKRVDKCAKAIKKGQFKGFAKCINESGESSYKLLQNCYSAKDVKQRIPLALAISKKNAGVLAIRVHGGGFMGTAIAYVNSASTQNYVSDMKKVFGNENVFVIGVRNFGACQVEI